MEEIEASTEHLEHEIHHNSEHSAGAKWISWIALSSALLAVLAAISALLSSQNANESMIEQIQASDQWNYYQAKGIKAAVLGSKIELLTAQGMKVSASDQEKVAGYKKDQEEVSERAKEKEHTSEEHLRLHEIYARAVTMFQIAIGMAAISILTRRRKFGWIELAFSVIGLGFLIQGLLTP